jgi:hypothetical protein
MVKAVETTVYSSKNSAIDYLPLPHDSKINERKRDTALCSIAQS